VQTSGALVFPPRGWGDIVSTVIEAFGDPDVHQADFAYADATGTGCDSHPDLASHERLGHALAERITEVLGW
jgi:hypothetical protein